MTEEFIQKMKGRLLEEKQAVQVKIDELTLPEEEMENPDLGDLGLDAADDILNESLLSVHRSILDKIDSALARVENGSYGVCQICGAPISEAALEAEPWAEHCSVCGHNRTFNEEE